MLTAVRRNRTRGKVAQEVTNPLTFEAIDSCTLGFIIGFGVDTSHVEYVEYSLDNGQTWIRTYNEDERTQNIRITISMQARDKVMWRGMANGYGSHELTNWTSQFYSTGKIAASGSIMSMLNPDFENITTLQSRAFMEMFKDCNYLISAPELPATILGAECYSEMFRNCSELIEAPELPAMTMLDKCYYRMFHGCSKLTVAPELPSITLAERCYMGMFAYCSLLTNAPALPATKTKGACYSSMFDHCTSLAVAPNLPAVDIQDIGEVYIGCYESMFKGCVNLTQPPALPALQVSNNCYREMFSGCTKITESPVLPAEQLVSYCYESMFYGCSMLNRITMLATSVGSQSLTSWVSGVASQGVFIKNAAMSGLPRGSSGIPNNWTVENYTN